MIARLFYVLLFILTLFTRVKVVTNHNRITVQKKNNNSEGKKTEHQNLNLYPTRTFISRYVDILERSDLSKDNI